MGLSLPDGRPETKNEARRLESGQDSVTRLLPARGLTSLKCGVDHAARLILDARTLFTPGQPQLRVADNRRAAMRKRRCDAGAISKPGTERARLPRSMAA